MDENVPFDTKRDAGVVIRAKSAEEPPRYGPAAPVQPSTSSRISLRSALPQVIASCAALSLTVHAGVNMAFSAIMIPQLEQDSDSAIRIDRDSASWIAAAVAVTTPIGSLACGPLMDWAGRRATCLMTVVPFVAAWLLLPLAAGPWPSLGLVYASRALTGVASGLTTAAGVYVSEVAHPSLRPALLCLNSVFVAVGILATASLGLVLHWSWMGVVFAATAAASGAALLLLAPESPHWLLSMAPGRPAQRRVVLARAALHRLNKDEQVMEASWDRLAGAASGPSGPSPCKRGTGRSGSDGEAQHLLGHRVLRSVAVFAQPATAKPMLLLAALFVVQQLSGTYVIIFYAVPLFAQIGSRVGTVLDEFGVMVIMSAVRFVMSVVTALLSQRFGRRPMLLASGLGMAVSAAAAGLTLVTAPRAAAGLAAGLVAELRNATTPGSSVLDSGEVFEASWPSVVFVITFVMFSSLGYLVMPWTLVSELLPLASRGMGSGLLVSLAYVLMFGVVKSFPYVMAVMGPRGVFYMFGGVATAGSLFVFCCLPETLGKSLHEIEGYFVERRSESVDN